MNRLLYPPEWQTIALAIKAANGYVCQACNRQCRRPGELNLGWQYTLTVAHYEGVYHTEAVFLVALCLPCHFLHDAPRVWQSRRRARRLRQMAAGQLVLFSENITIRQS